MPNDAVGRATGLNYQGRMPSVDEAHTSDAESAMNRLNARQQRFEVRSPNGTTAKKGVMFSQMGSDGNPVYRRDLPLSLRSRSGEAFRTEANNIRKDFEAAYAGKINPQLHQALMNGIDQYLTSRNHQFGTKTFVKLKQAFDQAVAQQDQMLSAGGRRLDAQTSQWLSGIRSDSDESALKVMQNKITLGVNRMLKEQGSSATRLESEDIMSYRVDSPKGQSPKIINVALWALDRPVIDPTTLKRGEVGAALAQGLMPGVAKPEAFLLRVEHNVNQSITHLQGDNRAVTVASSYAETFEVKPDELETFVRAQAQHGAKIVPIGVRIPMFAGSNLVDLMAEKRLKTNEQISLAKGLYQGAKQLQGANLLLHDIRPGGIAFDRKTGAVTLLDLGSSVSMGALKRTSEKPGAEWYHRPDLRSDDNDSARPGVPHGVGADRYAIASTLLSVAVPALGRLETKVLGEVLNDAFNDIQGGSGKKWLDAIYDALSKEMNRNQSRDISDSCHEMQHEIVHLHNDIENIINSFFAASREDAQGALTPAAARAWENLGLAMGAEVKVSSQTMASRSELFKKI